MYFIQCNTINSLNCLPYAHAWPQAMHASYHMWDCPNFVAWLPDSKCNVLYLATLQRRRIVRPVPVTYPLVHRFVWTSPQCRRPWQNQRPRNAPASVFRVRWKGHPRPQSVWISNLQTCFGVVVVRSWCEMVLG